MGRFRGVTACQGHAVSLRQPDQTARKAVHPTLRQAARQRQRKKCGDRLSAHGGDIAQPSRQASVANRFRRMPVAPEVNSLQREIRRNQRVFLLLLASAPRKPQHGAVVSDSSQNGGARPRPRQTANLCDQGFFGNHHAHQYKRRIRTLVGLVRGLHGLAFQSVSIRAWRADVTCPTITSDYPPSVTSNVVRFPLTRGTQFGTFYQTFTKILCPS